MDILKQTRSTIEVSSTTVVVHGNVLLSDSVDKYLQHTLIQYFLLYVYAYQKSQRFYGQKEFFELETTQVVDVIPQ